MASVLVDLGKQLEIDPEPGCWASVVKYQIILQGDLGQIERTLELALAAVRRGRTG